MKKNEINLRWHIGDIRKGIYYKLRNKNVGLKRMRRIYWLNPRIRWYEAKHWEKKWSTEFSKGRTVWPVVNKLSSLLKNREKVKVIQAKHWSWNIKKKHSPPGGPRGAPGGDRKNINRTNSSLPCTLSQLSTKREVGSGTRNRIDKYKEYNKIPKRDRKTIWLELTKKVIGLKAWNSYDRDEKLDAINQTYLNWYWLPFVINKSAIEKRIINQQIFNLELTIWKYRKSLNHIKKLLPNVKNNKFKWQKLLFLAKKYFNEYNNLRFFSLFPKYKLINLFNKNNKYKLNAKINKKINKKSTPPPGGPWGAPGGVKYNNIITLTLKKKKSIFFQKKNMYSSAPRGALGGPRRGNSINYNKVSNIICNKKEVLKLFRVPVLSGQGLKENKNDNELYKKEDNELYKKEVPKLSTLTEKVENEGYTEKKKNNKKYFVINMITNDNKIKKLYFYSIDQFSFLCKKNSNSILNKTNIRPPGGLGGPPAGIVKNNSFVSPVPTQLSWDGDFINKYNNESNNIINDKDSKFLLSVYKLYKRIIKLKFKNSLLSCMNINNPRPTKKVLNVLVKYCFNKNTLDNYNITFPLKFENKMAIRLIKAHWLYLWSIRQKKLNKSIPFIHLFHKIKKSKNNKLLRILKFFNKANKLVRLLESDTNQWNLEKKLQKSKYYRKRIIINNKIYALKNKKKKLLEEYENMQYKLIKHKLGIRWLYNTLNNNRSKYKKLWKSFSFIWLKNWLYKKRLFFSILKKYNKYYKHKKKNPRFYNDYNRTSSPASWLEMMFTSGGRTSHYNDYLNRFDYFNMYSLNNYLKLSLNKPKYLKTNTKTSAPRGALGGPRRGEINTITKGNTKKNKSTLRPTGGLGGPPAGEDNLKLWYKSVFSLIHKKQRKEKSRIFKIKKLLRSRKRRLIKKKNELKFLFPQFFPYLMNNRFKKYMLMLKYRGIDIKVIKRYMQSLILKYDSWNDWYKTKLIYRRNILNSNIYNNRRNSKKYLNNKFKSLPCPRPFGTGTKKDYKNDQKYIFTYKGDQFNKQNFNVFDLFLNSNVNNKDSGSSSLKKENIIKYENKKKLFHVPYTNSAELGRRLKKNLLNNRSNNDYFYKSPPPGGPWGAPGGVINRKRKYGKPLNIINSVIYIKYMKYRKKLRLNVLANCNLINAKQEYNNSKNYIYIYLNDKYYVFANKNNVNLPPPGGPWGAPGGVGWNFSYDSLENRRMPLKLLKRLTKEEKNIQLINQNRIFLNFKWRWKDESWEDILNILYKNKIGKIKRNRVEKRVLKKQYMSKLRNSLIRSRMNKLWKFVKVEMSKTIKNINILQRDILTLRENIEKKRLISKNFYKELRPPGGLGGPPAGLNINETKYNFDSYFEYNIKNYINKINNINTKPFYYSMSFLNKRYLNLFNLDIVNFKKSYWRKISLNKEKKLDNEYANFDILINFNKNINENNIIRKKKGINWLNIYRIIALHKAKKFTYVDTFDNKDVDINIRLKIKEVNKRLKSFLIKKYGKKFWIWRRFVLNKFKNWRKSKRNIRLAAKKSKYINNNINKKIDMMNNIKNKFINNIINSRIKNTLQKPYFTFPVQYIEKSSIPQTKHWTSSTYSYFKHDNKENNFFDIYTSKLIKLFFSVKYLKRKEAIYNNIFQIFKFGISKKFKINLNKMIAYTSLRAIKLNNNISLFQRDGNEDPLILKLKWTMNEISKSLDFRKYIEFRKFVILCGFTHKRRFYMKKMRKILLSKPLFKHTPNNLIIDLYLYENIIFTDKFLPFLLRRRSILKYMYSMYVNYSIKIKETINRPPFFYINIISPYIFYRYFSILQDFKNILFRLPINYTFFLLFIQLKIFNTFKNSLVNTITKHKNSLISKLSNYYSSQNYTLSPPPGGPWGAPGGVNNNSYNYGNYIKKTYDIQKVPQNLSPYLISSNNNIIDKSNFNNVPFKKILHFKKGGGGYGTGAFWHQNVANISKYSKINAFHLPLKIKKNIYFMYFSLKKNNFNPYFYAKTSEVIFDVKKNKTNVYSIYKKYWKYFEVTDAKLQKINYSGNSKSKKLKQKKNKDFTNLNSFNTSPPPGGPWGAPGGVNKDNKININVNLLSQSIIINNIDKDMVKNRNKDKDKKKNFGLNKKSKNIKFFTVTNGGVSLQLLENLENRKEFGLEFGPELYKFDKNKVSAPRGALGGPRRGKINKVKKNYRDNIGISTDYVNKNTDKNFIVSVSDNSLNYNKINKNNLLINASPPGGPRGAPGGDKENLVISSDTTNKELFDNKILESKENILKLNDNIKNKNISLNTSPPGGPRGAPGGVKEENKKDTPILRYKTKNFKFNLLISFFKSEIKDINLFKLNYLNRREKYNLLTPPGGPWGAPGGVKDNLNDLFNININSLGLSSSFVRNLNLSPPPGGPWGAPGGVNNEKDYNIQYDIFSDNNNSNINKIGLGIKRSHKVYAKKKKRYFIKNKNLEKNSNIRNEFLINSSSDGDESKSKYINYNNFDFASFVNFDVNVFFNKHKDFSWLSSYWYFNYSLIKFKVEFLNISRNVLKTTKEEILPLLYYTEYNNKTYLFRNYIYNDMKAIYINNDDSFSSTFFGAFTPNYREGKLNEKLSFNVNIFKPYYRYMLPIFILNNYIKFISNLKSSYLLSKIENLLYNFCRKYQTLHLSLYKFITVKILLDLLHYNYRSLIRIKPKYFSINKLRRIKSRYKRMGINSWFASIKFIKRLRKARFNFWFRYHKISRIYYKQILLLGEQHTSRKIFVPFVLYFEDLLFNLYGKWAIIRLWPLKKLYLSSFILARRLISLLVWKRKKWRPKFIKITRPFFVCAQFFRLEKTYSDYIHNTSLWPNTLVNNLGFIYKSKLPLYRIFENFSYEHDRPTTPNLNIIKLKNSFSRDYYNLYNDKTNHHYSKDVIKKIFSIKKWYIKGPILRFKFLKILYKQNLTPFYNNILRDKLDFSKKSWYFNKVTKRNYKLRIKDTTYYIFLKHWLLPFNKLINGIVKETDVSGIRILAKGRFRLFKRGLRKFKYLKINGHLRGSSYRSHEEYNNVFTIPSTRIRNDFKSNIDYSSLTFFNKTGVLNFKVWVSSRISADVNELLLHLVRIKELYNLIFNKYFYVKPWLKNIAIATQHNYNFLQLINYKLSSKILYSYKVQYAHLGYVKKVINSLIYSYFFRNKTNFSFIYYLHNYQNLTDTLINYPSRPTGELISKSSSDYIRDKLIKRMAPAYPARVVHSEALASERTKFKIFKLVKSLNTLNYKSANHFYTNYKSNNNKVFKKFIYNKYRNKKFIHLKSKLRPPGGLGGPPAGRDKKFNV